MIRPMLQKVEGRKAPKFGMSTERDQYGRPPRGKQLSGKHLRRREPTTGLSVRPTACLLFFVFIFFLSPSLTKTPLQRVISPHLIQPMATNIARTLHILDLLNTITINIILGARLSHSSAPITSPHLMRAAPVI